VVASDPNGGACGVVRLSGGGEGVPPWDGPGQGEAGVPCRRLRVATVAPTGRRAVRSHAAKACALGGCQAALPRPDDRPPIVAGQSTAASTRLSSFRTIPAAWGVFEWAAVVKSGERRAPPSRWHEADFESRSAAMYGCRFGPSGRVSPRTARLMWPPKKRAQRTERRASVRLSSFSMLRPNRPIDDAGATSTV